jgi:phosphoribosylaminoimidazole-succinocarboxamide synthase
MLNAALWRDPARDANSPTSHEERSRLQSPVSLSRTIHHHPTQEHETTSRKEHNKHTSNKSHIMSSDAAVTKVDLSQYNIKKIASGKVREIFEIDDQTLLFVATDRISAYDVILNNVSIPFVC